MWRIALFMRNFVSSQSSYEEWSKVFPVAYHQEEWNEPVPSAYQFDERLYALSTLGNDMHEMGLTATEAEALIGGNRSDIAYAVAALLRANSPHWGTQKKFYFEIRRNHIRAIVLLVQRPAFKDFNRGALMAFLLRAFPDPHLLLDTSLVQTVFGAYSIDVVDEYLRTGHSMTQLALMAKNGIDPSLMHSFSEGVF
jgi:hypothetical protein